MPKRIRKPASKLSSYSKKALNYAKENTGQINMAAAATVSGEVSNISGNLRNIGNQYVNQQLGSLPNIEQRQYRSPNPVYPQGYREPPMPQQIGEGYRQPYYPPPKEPLLGPLEKKILMYGLIFVIVAVLVLVVIRVISHKVDGYYHSCTGYHSCTWYNHSCTGCHPS